MTTGHFKNFVLSIVVLLFSSQSLAAGMSSEGPFERLIVGTWHFYQVLYQGTKRPPFNPNLQLYFQFNDSGESRIFYYRTNERGFCERKGHYFLDEDTLVDRVTWVNPRNAVGCGQDPDMRMGNETRTQIDFVDGDFHLYLSLSGEPLIYIWQPVDEIPVPPINQLQ